MYMLLLLIPIGLFVGWLAGRSLEGNGYGPYVDLSMGVGGAVAGGLVMRAMGFSGIGGNVLIAFMAICCAALLTTLVALANGRTIYTRVF